MWALPGDCMGRRTRRDWLMAGLEVVTAEGRDGLKVEALCARMELTKGSFYHHFRDLAEYKSGLLELYRQEGTLQIIEIVERAATPRARLERLLEVVVEYSRAAERNAEMAIRAWALQDDEVRGVQREVDARRVEYVAQLIEQIGAAPPRARLLAELVYATLIGSEQMQPPISGDRLRALFEEHLRLVDHHLNPEAT
jgi:AcrR family transcriptional regulator